MVLTNQIYHHEFVAHIETLESYGGYGTIGVFPNTLNALLKNMHNNGTISSADSPTSDDLCLETDIIHDEYLAALLLSGANYIRFEKLREYLSNLYAMGDDCYPRTVVACLSVLDRYNVRLGNKQQPKQPKQEDKQVVVFAQNATTKPLKPKPDKQKDHPGGKDNSVKTKGSSTKSKHSPIPSSSASAVAKRATSPLSVPWQSRTRSMQSPQRMMPLSKVRTQTIFSSWLRAPPWSARTSSSWTVVAHATSL